MDYNIKDTFDIGLEEAGQDFTIWYRTGTSVYSGGGIKDPFYHGSKTVYNYSTGESGMFWVSTSYVVRGILNQFSNGLQYIEDGNFKFGVKPVGIARATFWLNDVLVNTHSFSGPTFFTNCHTVQCMGNSYKLKNQTRVGYGDEYALVVILDKID